MKTVTAAMFKKMTGLDPEQDDLERCNCPKVGHDGHRQCGVCKKHNKPRFVCGCRKSTDNREEKPMAKRVEEHKKRTSRLMTEKQLSESMGVGIPTINGWIKEGLPFTEEVSRQTGKRVRVFNCDEFVGWCVSQFQKGD